VDLNPYIPLAGGGGAVVGAAVGGVVTWLNQAKTRRQADELAAESRRHAEELAFATRQHADNLAVDAKRAALRDNRRDAIYAFIEAAQAVDRHVDAREKTSAWDDEAARVAMHQMWYRLLCVRVVGSPELIGAADRFAWRMNDALWHGKPADYPTNVYDYMSDERDKFIAAATNELYSREIYESERPERFEG